MSEEAKEEDAWYTQQREKQIQRMAAFIISWYAGQGSREAQSFLGHCYAKGLGVDQNI